jgi:ketosteroid isomerase-like protein
MARTHASPVEVFHRLIAGIAAGRWQDLADLYADDAVVEQPMAPRQYGHPVRMIGRTAIAEHFARAAHMPVVLRAQDVVVHATDDPETIVVEYDYAGQVAGREPFRSANVQVLTVRDGRIVFSRDYHDHSAIAAAVASSSTLEGPHT